ncbi:MAG TPA: hypothetical protein PLB52_00350 [Candidatus Moranbacteria bacterium]|nr:hypothetical protein [Candidatus Moranbacteria bacterium]
MSKDQLNCKHDWRILTYDGRDGPGVSECKKCGLWLSHSNRLQLEMNKHITGYQKKISLASLIISILALILSVTAFIYKIDLVDNFKSLFKID